MSHRDTARKEEKGKIDGNKDLHRRFASLSSSPPSLLVRDSADLPLLVAVITRQRPGKSAFAHVSTYVWEIVFITRREKRGGVNSQHARFDQSQHFLGAISREGRER